MEADPRIIQGPHGEDRTKEFHEEPDGPDRVTEGRGHKSDESQIAAPRTYPAT